MNDRARAIEVLQRARDLLAERLTERILESRDEILADAMGMSFQSEIDAIYDQLGSRLSHVSAMLSSLPKPRAPEREPTEDFARPPVRPARRAFPALPAPLPIAGLLAVGPEAGVTFKRFAIQIQAGDLIAAGATLAELLAVDPPRALRCAEAFQRRFRQQPEVLFKAIQLRNELASGSINGTLILLWECFELQGPESIGVIHTLKKRLAG